MPTREDTVADAQIRPAWHFGRRAIAAGLVLGPGLWILQLVLDYGLSSYGCFPTFTPGSRITPGLGWIWPTIAIINLVALALSLSAAGLSFVYWRRTWANDESSFNDVLEKGEGPAKYLEMWGMITGLSFSAVIIFNTIALFVVPLCGA